VKDISLLNIVSREGCPHVAMDGVKIALWVNWSSFKYYQSLNQNQKQIFQDCYKKQVDTRVLSPSLFRKFSRVQDKPHTPLICCMVWINLSLYVCHAVNTCVRTLHCSSEWANHAGNFPY